MTGEINHAGDITYQKYQTVVVGNVVSFLSQFVLFKVLFILMLQVSQVSGFQELQQKDHGSNRSLWERHGYRESEHCVQLRHA